MAKYIEIIGSRQGVLKTRTLGVVIERKLTLHWEGGRGKIAHSSYSRHQIPSGTLNCLFPCNIPSKDIFFFQISQPAEICLKNKYFEEQVHWVPLIM